MPESSAIAARNITLLVVEDDPGRADAVCELIHPLGTVHRAVGCAAAAAQLRSGADADLVILIARDRAQAEDSCRLLRADELTFVPILVLLPEKHTDQRFENELAAESVLNEPLEHDVLLARVRALLRLRHRWSTCEAEMSRLRRVALLKDDLVALILHDLRNPLAGVFGFLSALDLSTRDSRHSILREDVEGAMASARKLHEVLGDLLEIRMLEEGAMPVRKAETRLNGLGAEAVSSLDGAARERSVRLSLDVAAGETAVLDSRLVRRALENLISNGLKYSPAGTTILVSVRADRGGARLRVSDSGPGIPDELKEAVFDKFATVEAVRGQTRRGFGLGLYQVRLVVEAHGGTASIGDREGGGAVVELWFPATTPTTLTPAGGQPPVRP